MKRQGRLAALSVCAALAGCMVGPHYAPPAPPAPPSDGFAAANSAVASIDQPPPSWWRLYDDPAIDQLVQEALTHNKSLLVAVANLAQARGALDLARAGLFPSTALSAGAQYGVGNDAQILAQVKGSGTPPPAPVYTAGLDASYELDLFGHVRRTIEAAKADVDAQQAAEDASRISVAGETTRAYLNACAYAQELAVARESLGVVTQTYEVTVKQALDGGASSFDVARAHEQVAQVQASLPIYENQRRTALFQLAVLTGRPPEEISQAADACKSVPKLKTVLPVGDIRGLFRRRPDVRQAERQLAGNVARIGVATAALYPTITLNASAETAAKSLSGLGELQSLSWLVGPLLNWNFPNTLVAQGQIREARGAASASYANFQATVLQALQDTETALSSDFNELQRNAALVEALNQSQLAFNLAKTQFQSGRISYLDLLTAQGDLVTANANLAASNQALASDQVTVFKALGGGWEQAPDIQPLPIHDAGSGKDIKVR